MKQDVLLAEIDEALRTMPAQGEFARRDPHTMPWLGGALAVLKSWNTLETISLGSSVDDIFHDNLGRSEPAYRLVQRLLHQARADVQMKLGVSSLVVPPGASSIISMKSVSLLSRRGRTFSLLTRISTPTSCRGICRMLRKALPFGCSVAKRFKHSWRRWQRSLRNQVSTFKCARRAAFTTVLFS